MTKKSKQPPKLRTILHTCGNGWWSQAMRKVQISKVVLRISVDDAEQSLFSRDTYSELKVYFTKKTWDPEKHGLIYTDQLFIKELNSWFKKLKFDGKAYYTEQGMQGDNYVSCDVDNKFIKSWVKFGYNIDKRVYDFPNDTLRSRSVK